MEEGDPPTPRKQGAKKEGWKMGFRQMVTRITGLAGLFQDRPGFTGLAGLFQDRLSSFGEGLTFTDYESVSFERCFMFTISEMFPTIGL